MNYEQAGEYLSNEFETATTHTRGFAHAKSAGLSIWAVSAIALICIAIAKINLPPKNPGLKTLGLFMFVVGGCVGLMSLFLNVTGARSFAIILKRLKNKTSTLIEGGNGIEHLQDIRTLVIRLKRYLGMNLALMLSPSILGGVAGYYSWGETLDINTLIPWAIITISAMAILHALLLYKISKHNQTLVEWQVEDIVFV